MAKIGLDLRMLGNHHGGIGRYVLELAKHLLAIDTENQYWLFRNDDSQILQDQFSIFNARTHIIKVKARHYSLAEQTSFLRTLDKYNFDLMHFPNFNVPILYKKPFVVTIHDLAHHKISGHKKSHLLHFYAYKKVIK